MRLFSILVLTAASAVAGPFDVVLVPYETRSSSGVTPSYAPMTFGLNSPPLITSTTTDFTGPVSPVTVSASVFTPQPPFTGAITYHPGDFAPDWYTIGLTSIRTTPQHTYRQSLRILLDPYDSYWGPVWGFASGNTLVLPVYQFNTNTNLWESQLDLLATLQAVRLNDLPLGLEFSEYRDPGTPSESLVWAWNAHARISAIHAVPEPATLPLIAAAAVLFLRRRKT
ncbi:MAG: PEP-CTERM sorting domain-containing protein [Bryobacterales bacterium]|nr:PEP-CTERM sorting domain-containing protein [Bryobacterales bacterium]